MIKNLSQLAVWFFFLGFFTCTWDRVLTLELGGFTLKAHQLLFFSAFLLAIFGERKRGLAHLLQPFRHLFPLSILALVLYYGLSSPWSVFPLKSSLYAAWIAFNLCTIWYTAALLTPVLPRERLLQFVWVVLGFHVSVVLVDHVAYQFGFTHGLIGFNQDEILKWGVSRPHAFAFEPSYIAVFFCFSLLLTYSSFTLLPKARRWPYLFILMLGLFSLIIVTSRTGWVSLVVGIFLILFLYGWRKRKYPWQELLMLVLAVGTTAGIYFVSIPKTQQKALDKSLVQSVYTGNDGSANSRLRAHLYAWQMAKETHWLGTGLGASYKYWTETRSDENHPHNPPFNPAQYGNEIIMSIWGQLLAEGGVPALVLYGLAGIFFLLRLAQSWWQKPEDLMNLGALASASVFFCLVAFGIGNVARGDIWVWLAIWWRMSAYDSLLPTNT